LNTTVEEIVDVQVTTNQLTKVLEKENKKEPDRFLLELLMLDVLLDVSACQGQLPVR
jgi:hypothetical protein